MAFPSAEEAQQRKANFFAAHDAIEAHNSKPGVTFQLAHNRFSLMVCYTYLMVSIQAIEK